MHNSMLAARRSHRSHRRKKSSSFTASTPLSRTAHSSGDILQQARLRATPSLGNAWSHSTKVRTERPEEAQYSARGRVGKEAEPRDSIEFIKSAPLRTGSSQFMKRRSDPSSRGSAREKTAGKRRYGKTFRSSHFQSQARNSDISDMLLTVRELERNLRRETQARESAEKTLQRSRHIVGTLRSQLFEARLQVVRGQIRLEECEGRSDQVLSTKGAKYDAICALFKAVNDSRSYEMALRACLPLQFSLNKAPRFDLLGSSEQIYKDIVRESAVRINGKSYAMPRKLQQLEKKLTTEAKALVGCFTDEPGKSEVQELVSLILRTSNRTVCGGDLFDCVNDILQSNMMVIVSPVSNVCDSVEIAFDRKLRKIHITTKMSFKVSCLDDDSGEMMLWGNTNAILYQRISLRPPRSSGLIMSVSISRIVSIKIKETKQ